MVDISSLIVSEKTTEVEHPDPSLEGFKVQISYLGRQELQKIRKKCTTMKYSKKTRQMEESVDEDLFLKIYTEKTIKGWEGLTAAYLEYLMPIDLGSLDPETKIEYNNDNAVTLMKNSIEFDRWISEVISDLSVFNKGS